MSDSDFFDKQALRQQAEDIIQQQQDMQSADLDEIKNIFHELKVHQIELELQNEELRRIQSQLEESKQRFLNLYNRAPVGYITLDRSGMILQANYTFMDMVQIDSHDMLQRPFIDFICPQERDVFLGRYRAFFKQPGGKNIETSLLRRDNSIFLARLEGRFDKVAIANDEKQPVILIVVIDISRQKRAEITCQQQAQFLESLLAAIPSPVFYKDCNGRYLGCNAAFEKLTGKARDEIIGKKVHDLWPKAQSDTYKSMDLQLFATAGTQQYESIVIDAAGVPHDMVFYKAAFPDANHQVAGLVGVLLDITDRKTTEEELVKRSQINAAMAELAQKLLSGSDINDTSAWVLNKAQELTDSPYGFVGYIDGNTGYLVSPTLTRGIWSQCKVAEKTVVFEEFTGLWGWVLQNGEPLLSNAPELDERSTGVPAGHIAIRRFLSVPVLIQGHVVGIIALCNAENDYTDSNLSVVTRLASLFGLAIQRMCTEEDLRKAKEAAEAANIAKSQFLATMSHEIRTPMNAIIGLTDLTLEENLQRSQRENLEIVQSSAKHLMTLLNDILDLSKIEAGRIELEKSEFDLHNLISEAVKAFSARARDKNLELRQSMQDLPQTVIGDRHRLYQVLFNLLSNALKFTQQGYVAINIYRNKSTASSVALTFVVEDSGIGIPESKQQKIFEPFTQADSSTTRRFGGTGLGLSISRKLIEAMGGTIGVKSSVDQGSKFYFTIPFHLSSKQETQKNSGEKTTASPTSGSASSPRPMVLVAEDNAINQKLAQMLLAKKGCRVLIAENGRQAIELYRNEQFDLILMDVEMPDMNGIDATKIIRNWESENQQRIPIIAMTAHAMKGDKERFLYAGMDNYVSKPIDAEALYKVLDEYLFS